MNRVKSTSLSPAAKHKTKGKYQKVERIAVNEHGQATKLQLCLCTKTNIQTFHITSITFWLCFYIWFCTTNIYNEISTDINLTLTQHELAGALSITSTIFFRVIISDLCFKYGSRVSYVIVLISTSLSLVGIAIIQSSIGYIVLHIFLGISGASFVVTQYHTTRMFSGKIVGFAQAMTAGFGNFGGGCSSFLMPLLVYYTNLSWRWYMVIYAAIAFLFSFVYYLLLYDFPEQQHVSMSMMDIADIDRENQKSDESLISVCAPPDKQIGGSFKDAASDYRTWILFICYGACFGVEIAFYLVAPHYFQREYGLNEMMSGLIVMIWSSINTFARPFGGGFADKYSMITRVKILFIILFLESIFLIVFGIIGHLSIYGAIISSLLFSICVHIAEGVTFNITQFIQPKCIGHVIGIVGSGGNFGGTVFVLGIFIPYNNTRFDEQYAWIILGIVVMILSFLTLKIKFTERELHGFNQTIQGCYNLDNVKTSNNLKVTSA